MPRLPLKTVALALLLAAPNVPPALATPERSDARFDVELRGLRAGVLILQGAHNASSYAAAARLETTGLVNLIRRVRFDAGVEGRVQGGRLAPLSYREDVDTGRRESRTVMEFRNGVPRIVSAEPEREPRPWHLDPATQGGTVDPMTTLFQILRDVPREAACRLDLPLFDGRRRGQVVLGAPQPNGDGVICHGEFRRVAGYSDDEMAEATSFPFRVVYAPAENGLLQVIRVEAESLHGRGRLVRR